MAQPINYIPAKDIHEAIQIRRNLTNNPADMNEHIRDDSLMEYANKVEVVKELGVYQGVTAAMFLTQPNVKKYIGVDVNFNLYNTHLKHHIDAYCEEHSKVVELYKTSSTDPSTVSPCDMLHIDSLHQARHLKKELILHLDSVRKYVAFHDVNQDGRRLFKVVMQHIKDKPEWQVAIDHPKGKCGYLIIERIDNV